MLIRNRASFSPPWGDPRRWLAALLSLLLLAGAFDVGAAVDRSVGAAVTQQAGLEPSGDDHLPIGRVEAELRAGAPGHSASADDDRSPPSVADEAFRQYRHGDFRLVAVLGSAPATPPRHGVAHPGHPVRAPPA